LKQGGRLLRTGHVTRLQTHQPRKGIETLNNASGASAAKNCCKHISLERGLKRLQRQPLRLRTVVVANTSASKGD